MNRREFLRIAGLSLLPLERIGWAASSPGTTKRLVVVFLRGAVDGLSVVAPYKDPLYYESRPSIAIPRPGAEGGLLDLDGQFGLHPALSALMPLWQQKSLAFIHASGSSDPNRSHFDAQDYMESGTPGIKSTPDGWMNRVLAVLPGKRTPTSAISVGATLPRIMSGKMTVANLTLGQNTAQPMVMDRPVIAKDFDMLYANNQSLGKTYQAGRNMRSQLLSDLQNDMMAADHGAPTSAGFPSDARMLARMIKRDPHINIVFLALGGWDTHVNQGSSHGQLANHLYPLGEGLAILAHELGSEFTNTTVLVMSEFGRTVRENGNGGTDHGHGNVMWLLGGIMGGGKVYGQWPSLEEIDLYQGRDLEVTTDFRSVATMVLQQQFRLDDAQLRHIFPAFQANEASLTGLI
ncbi:MAG: DUF1501 domain-containing protein [Pseudomonadales bacterium]|nr:DUF1501 domain-containing protein [Pseudomonadales bacterium]